MLKIVLLTVIEQHKFSRNILESNTYTKPSKDYAKNISNSSKLLYDKILINESSKVGTSPPFSLS